MSEVNKTQVGGDHYRKNEYQCWDFIEDTRIGFILGNAVKYVSRWRDKNGIEDLRKTSHYLQKAIERGIKIDSINMCEVYQNCILRYVKQLNTNEATIVVLICTGEFHLALESINSAIEIECTLDEIIKPTEEGTKECHY